MKKHIAALACIVSAVAFGSEPMNVLMIAVDDLNDWTNLATNPEYKNVIEQLRKYLPETNQRK